MNQPDEFAPFMRTAWPGLMRYLHGMQATKDEAEDAAQYALTEAYAAWSRIEYPHAWVCVPPRAAGSNPSGKPIAGARSASKHTRWTSARPLLVRRRRTRCAGRMRVY